MENLTWVQSRSQGALTRVSLVFSRDSVNTYLSVII